MPPLQRFDPLSVALPDGGGASVVTIDLPVLRGGAAAAARNDGPAPAAPALPRNAGMRQAGSQQPLPAWIGHILEGGR